LASSGDGSRLLGLAERLMIRLDHEGCDRDA
jgi:hypothetical protein